LTITRPAEKGSEESLSARMAINIVSAVFALFLLYLISFYDYLLFHTFAEVFSIVIAFSIFLFAWNSRKYLDNFCFIFLGIAYFHVAVLDLLHTLAYEGMPFFPAYSHYATEVWIAARYMESISFFIAFSFLSTSRRINPVFIFVLYSMISALIIGAIFFWEIFPVLFIHGKGLTLFKVVSEYIICFIIMVSIFILYRRKSAFDNKVFNYLLSSLVLTIFSELAFTFYINVYGFSNLVGHIFKIISFKLMYQAIIATGLTRPYDLLFRELKQSELALKEANQTKDRFFSIISHDLRAPFTSLMGFSETLIDSYDSFDEKTKKNFARAIYDSAEQIYNLLDNLLQWSLAQTNSIVFKPGKVDFSTVVDENISLMEKSAELKEITLVSAIDGDRVLFADINMLNTILRNLFSNAIKFTGKGGNITLSSTAKKDFLEITIADTGVGMSDEYMKKIFRIDEKHLTRGTEKETGTGIGLVLCKDFIEKHGGKIWVESKPGEGSRFSFTLPLC